MGKQNKWDSGSTRSLAKVRVRLWRTAQYFSPKALGTGSKECLLSGEAGTEQLTQGCNVTQALPPNCLDYCSTSQVSPTHYLRHPQSYLPSRNMTMTLLFTALQWLPVVFRIKPNSLSWHSRPFPVGSSLPSMSPHKPPDHVPCFAVTCFAPR